MARLANSAAHLCQRLQELYPHKLQLASKQVHQNHNSEQSSPFRRWTTGSGAGSSYRHHEHRNMYNKQMSEGSTQVSGSNSGGSNVSRWSLGLEHLLADPAGAEAFAHFLAKEFAAENIRFWWSCEQYSATPSAERRGALAAEIWQRHLADKAPEPVNVDAAARRAAALMLGTEPPPPELFQQAQKQIFNVMKFDSYPRFLRSGVHAECARADLRGLPLPYASTARENDTDTTKLKKSASNASERRRSGGASLLPWKLRTGRERSNSTQQNEPPPITDVVKSSQTAPGQCSLCRVVLPDGATSVVGVEASVTVGRLVDRLLQRRNLLCTTYDVLLKDGNQGTSTTIDPSSPSTLLGGREALVERRCVVRIELAGRCVAVRARAARRLRHVLRPVLARYAPGAAHRAVLRDGVVLHPDTVMQELDGARLQIVDVSENGEYRASASEPQRDDDADSLSDLAVRLQDDALRQQDEQSVSTASGSSRGSTTGACGARVRAALRPGPPLHHHPPDFLENLRETQRQRLQNKSDSSPPASPPPSAARTPPPLPPKPTHRAAPTVV